MITYLYSGGARRIILEPVQLSLEFEEKKMPGKFPILQEELRTYLNANYQKCVEAARIIRKASDERADMYEKMADEVKNELARDRDYFNALEG